MKNLTELVFILDRSGSMSGLEADTIGGFNSMIEKQKKEAGEALVSVVLFDDQTEVIYDRADIRQIQPMTDEQYFVRGCTALLDAIGGAISHIKDVRKRMPESERPEKTIFIITTDGMENASHRYNYAKIKKMIEKPGNLSSLEQTSMQSQKQDAWESEPVAPSITIVMLPEQHSITRS